MRGGKDDGYIQYFKIILRYDPIYMISGNLSNDCISNYTAVASILR